MDRPLQQRETRSLDELEKAQPSHDKHDIDSLSESHRDDEVTTGDEKHVKSALPRSPNCNDWDGPDDPDNPHNCTKIRARQLCQIC